MSARFDIEPTPIDGLVALIRKPIGDARGFLDRLYCADELRPVLGARAVAQVNRTLTRRAGTVRGLHFQFAPHAETKIVTCLRGRVYDVAVDLRPGSPTRLRWHARVLDGAAGDMFVIPEGFAHGFQTLESDCEMLYFHTAAYAPASEGGVHPLDPALGIAWPLPVAEMSARDAALPPAGALEREVTP